MKKYILISIIMLFVSFSLNSQVKRTLLEQHTGAWCGWCVDGTVVMDDIISLYPDQVIGVKVHNGDSMVIPEQAVLQSGLGISAYPTGTIDRKRLGSTVAQNRGDWKNYCISQVALQPKVEVNVSYNLNEQTRLLMVKVYANMLETVYEPLRFNAIIVEDSVSGVGTGWDQSNYLSNRAGYETNPYYKLPSKIVGYQHMKVARTYMGGAWGVQGSFTSPAVQGQIYSQEFSYTLPANWKLQHIKVVGFVAVEAPSNKEILNCAYGVKGEAKLQLTSTGSSKEVIQPNNAFTKEYKLQNITGAPLTYIVTAAKSSRTPASWKAEITSLTGNEVTLNGSDEKSLTLSLTPDETIGIGDATIKVSVKDDPNAFAGSGTITAYSSKISNIEVINAGEAQYSLATVLNTLGFDNYYALSSSDYSEMGPKFNRKTLIWNSGSAESPTTSEVSSIIEAIQSKVPVFLCGNQMTSALVNGGALQLFGADYYGYSTQGYGQAPWRVWLTGVANDPISGAYTSNIEGNLIKYLITLIKITNTQNTTPFMTFANSGFRVLYNSQTGKRDTFDITGPDAIFGIKVDNGQQRFALLSIVPHVMVNQTIRNNVIANIVNWINYIPTEVKTDDQSTVEIWPVPAMDNINFRFSGYSFNNIKIYNIEGELIDDVAVSEGKDNFNYNSSALSSGSYSAVLSNGKTQTTLQFSIVR